MSGVLRGFDPYMNIVMDDTVEERSNSQKINIGMVVRFFGRSLKVSDNYIMLLLQVVRGNSISLIEALERIV